MDVNSQVKGRLHEDVFALFNRSSRNFIYLNVFLFILNLNVSLWFDNLLNTNIITEALIISFNDWSNLLKPCANYSTINYTFVFYLVLVLVLVLIDIFEFILGSTWYLLKLIK